MKRCLQCHAPYAGARAHCEACRERIALHQKDREAYLAVRDPRKTLDDDAPLRVTYNPRSGNKKTGPIPVCITSSSTCPDVCRFKGDGCFAEFGFLRHHWANVSADGLTWSDFCHAIRRLRPGQLWRYAQAGDLPGFGDRLDIARLDELVAANAHARARGFAFTHKPLDLPEERDAVRRANARGFTINLSADDPNHLEERRALGVGPVALVVPQDAPRSPDYVLCPFETHGVTCKRCGLCAVPTRKAAVAFRAHGQFAARVDELVQLRRSA